MTGWGVRLSVGEEFRAYGSCELNGIDGDCVGWEGMIGVVEADIAVIDGGLDFVVNEEFGDIHVELVRGIVIVWGMG